MASEPMVRESSWILRGRQPGSKWPGVALPRLLPCPPGATPACPKRRGRQGGAACRAIAQVLLAPWQPAAAAITHAQQRHRLSSPDGYCGLVFACWQRLVREGTAQQRLPGLAGSQNADLDCRGHRCGSVLPSFQQPEWSAATVTLEGAIAVYGAAPCVDIKSLLFDVRDCPVFCCVATADASQGMEKRACRPCDAARTVIQRAHAYYVVHIRTHTCCRMVLAAMSSVTCRGTVRTADGRPG